MVKVLGPQNIAITPPSVASPVRSSPTSFGAPQADALAQAGQALAMVGARAEQLHERRQGLDDALFLAKLDSESDLDADALDEAEDYSPNTECNAPSRDLWSLTARR